MAVIGACEETQWCTIPAGLHYVDVWAVEKSGIRGALLPRAFHQLEMLLAGWSSMEQASAVLMAYGLWMV